MASIVDFPSQDSIDSNPWLDFVSVIRQTEESCLPIVVKWFQDTVKTVRN